MTRMLCESIFLVLITLLDVSKQKYVRQQTAVGCYKCHSINGSDARCGDPFHPAYNTERYYPNQEENHAVIKDRLWSEINELVRDIIKVSLEMRYNGLYNGCEQGQENRVGLFPALYCTKIKGTNLRTNQEMIIRSCSISAFDNMCGLFEFDHNRYSGCITSCARDACNNAITISNYNAVISIFTTVVSIFMTSITLSNVLTCVSFFGL